MLQRRQFIAASIAAGTISVLPYRAFAAGHSADVFATDSGEITITPISHASFVMQTPAGVIYVDPVGGGDLYADMPAPDLVLITHEHGDHFDQPTLDAIAPTAPLVTNPAVLALLSPESAARATAIANGETLALDGIIIDAIPAYNITPERADFHPQGRDNGYVVTIDGFRTYISGDTEDTPEMRALTDIDLAFVCMNLPFTMDATAAANAVSEFKPSYVYPYHYRGRDNGTQDPAEFAAMLAEGIEAKMGGWYA